MLEKELASKGMKNGNKIHRGKRQKGRKKTSHKSVPCHMLQKTYSSEAFLQKNKKRKIPNMDLFSFFEYRGCSVDTPK